MTAPTYNSLRLRVMLPAALMLLGLLVLLAALGRSFLRSEEVTAEVRGGLWSLLSVFGAAVAAYGLAVLYMLSGLARRMEQLAEGARRVEEGDLRTRLGGEGSDELGLLGRAFDQATERLASALAQIRGAEGGLQRGVRDIHEAADQVRRGTDAQVMDIDSAAQAARELVAALSGGVRQVEGVRDELRLTATVAQRLAPVSQEAAANLEDVERLVGGATEGIRQLAGAVGEMARTAGVLAETTVQTAGSIQDVRHSINKVRETATSAAGLAENASLDAERGALALADSLAGIEAIREASRAISGVTDGLQLRVGEINSVLHLISELTQRTNLLALNASIIAAQAGAEGRGFAVVADEIKDLARRTAASAVNIDSLIQAVAEGAQEARRTALQGSEAVEAGAAQTREAARTLTDILSRLRTWASMAKSIAQATDDQARSAAVVQRAIQDVQNLVAELAGKATEQNRRSEYLQRQTGRLGELVEGLTTATQEIREGTAQVADTLTRLGRMVEEMSGTQRSRVAEGERVRGILEAARRIASGHKDAVKALDRTVTELRVLGASISDEIGPSPGRREP